MFKNVNITYKINIPCQDCFPFHGNSLNLILTPLYEFSHMRRLAEKGNNWLPLLVLVLSLLLEINNDFLKIFTYLWLHWILVVVCRLCILSSRAQSPLCMWDTSSLTKDQSHIPCIRRWTQPLDH